MNKRIDLHMHTTYSDGTLSCEEIMLELEKKNIKYFAITDHENIESVSEMKELIKKNKVKLNYIPGVEIASTYLDKEFHLTVYGFDEKNNELRQLLNKIGQIRIDYGLNIISYIEKNLIKDGSVTISDFLEYEDNPKLGGWKALNYLIENKIVDSIVDYFELLGDFSVDKIFPDPKLVVEIAKKAGGTVFLAHPSSNEAGGLNKSILDYFKKLGVDGIECYSPYCKSDEEINYYLDYCRANDMFISGGSDYHGEFVSRELGYPEVSIEDISYDLFKKLVIS